MVSTVESTTTSTANYASSTRTFTNVIIVDFSTETIYTSTWLAPPKDISYTLTRTSTCVSEAIVVPTDVTYTLTSLPPAPTSAAITGSLPTPTKRSLAWGESFGNKTACLSLQSGTGVSSGAASLTAHGIGDGQARTLTVQGFGPGGNITAVTFTGNVTETGSAGSYPTSTPASVSTYWATKSNTPLSEEPATVAEPCSTHLATKSNTSLSGKPTSNMTETFSTHWTTRRNTSPSGQPTTSAISTQWATKSDIFLSAEPNKTFVTQWASTSNRLLSDQAVSSLSTDSKYPTTTVVSVSTHWTTKSDNSLSEQGVSTSIGFQYPNNTNLSISTHWATKNNTSLASKYAVITASASSQRPTTTDVSVSAHWATKDDTSYGGLTVLAESTEYTSASAISEDGSSIANVTGTTTTSPYGAANTTTAHWTIYTTTGLGLVTITLPLPDNGTTATSSIGSQGASTMAIPTTGSSGAGSKDIDTVLLAVFGILLFIT